MLHWVTRCGGLRTKMTAWVLVPTALILAAVGVVAFYASQQVTEELVLERNQDRTELLANQLSAELEAYQQPLALAASESENSPLYQFQAVLDREWPAGELAVFDGGVLVLDRDGKVMANVPARPQLYGETFPGLVLDFSPARVERLPVTDILFDEVGSSDVIAFSYPLIGAQGESRGTIVGLFKTAREVTRTSPFYRKIWALYIGRRETAYLVDGNGYVIFHPDTFLIGEDFSHLSSVQRALLRQTDAVRTEDIEGRDVVAGFTFIPRTSWALVTEQRWSEVTDLVRPYNRFLIGLLALGVIVPVTVVALGVRRITRPVRELTRAAEEVASGNFGQAIDVRTGDELETLAQQFNRMAQELQASYANLEQRVADRTRELSTLNAVSAVVSRSLELEEVMQAALRQTLQAMTMEAGAAFRVADGEELALMAHAGLSDSFIRQVRRLPLRRSIAAQAVREAAPVVRPVDGYPEGPLKSLLRTEGLASVISVPLVAKDEVLGVLNLATRRSRGMTSEERSLLASIGQQAGMAVENARLYDQAEEAAAAAERNRLARELHDAVSQTLFSASMIADVLPRLWQRNPEEAERRLADLRRLTRGAMAEMRTLLWELRPSALLDTNLDELLGQLAKVVAGRAHVEVVLDVERVTGLPADVKVALYRIAQEALNNVVKHANADRVVVRLHRGEEGLVELGIRDDGAGFASQEVPSGRLGLTTMAERAQGVGAELTIESVPGRGTEVTVRWEAVDERI